MKTHVSGSLRSMLKKFLAPAVFAFVIAVSTLPFQAFAADKSAKSESLVEVKYLGVINASPVFQVNIDNALQDDMYFSLKDEDGNVIYSEKFKDKKLSRKFQVQSNDGTNLKVTLNLFSKNDKKTQTFEIINVSTVVENMVVTKVN